MRIKLLVSITSLLLLVSCCPRETPDMSFVVVNHSKDSVYYKCSYGDGYLPSQWYSKVLDEHRVLKPEFATACISDKRRIYQTIMQSLQ